MKKTSPTKAADPVYVSMSSNCSRQMGSVAFDGLEKGASVDNTERHKTVLVSDPESPAAEESTVPPVSSGETFFRFMAEAARDQGYITQRGLESVMAALYPEVRG